MNIFQRMFSTEKPKIETRGLDYYDPTYGSLQFNANTSFRAAKSMRLSTVFRCIQVISDSVASLPLEPYKIDARGYKTKFRNHITYSLLAIEPNANMSRFTFFKTLVTHMLLKGNAYVEIIRDKTGSPMELKLLDPELVVVYIVDGNLKYQVAGREGYIDKANVIHVLNHSYDGIVGVSTIEFAINTLSTASDSEAHASGFFKGGANLAGIIKVTGNMVSGQADKIKSAWRSAFSQDTGNPNGIAVLEGNMDYIPISVNPRDAQMLESRQFNVIEICRFFGVAPSKAFDLHGSSYASVESNQLAFLTDTLTPLLEKIELEFYRKLYKPSERASIELRFDTSRLLRADMASLSTYYTQMLNLGVYTPNEIRMELQKEYVEGGDRAFIQVNLQPLDKLFADQTAPPNQIDNKIK